MVSLLRKHATHTQQLEATPSERHDVRQQPVGAVAMGGNAESPAHAFALWFAERAGFVTNSPHLNQGGADERHWPEQSRFAPAPPGLHATRRDTSEQGLSGVHLDNGDNCEAENFRCEANGGGRTP